MQNNRSSDLPRRLRWAALGAVLLSLAIWLSFGHRLGWTQTNVVEMKVDPVTELTYPERRDAFIAGIEFPATGLGVGVGFLALAWLLGRRRSA